MHLFKHVLPPRSEYRDNIIEPITADIYRLKSFGVLVKINFLHVYTSNISKVSYLKD